MKHGTKIVALGAALLVGACATNDISQPSEPFGKAVRHNIAAQYVEPTPEQKQNTYIKPNATRMATAQKRYETDQVEKPKDLKTTK